MSPASYILSSLWRNGGRTWRCRTARTGRTRRRGRCWCWRWCRV